MSKKKRQSLVLVILVVIFLSWIGVSTVWSSPNLFTEYPLSTIAITFWAQGTSNWCGPDALQSEIQYVNQYNNGTPVTTVVPIIYKATLWAFMRDNTCKEIGTGRDIALSGQVGDGNSDVRKMNIAYDFGVDPHAMAWTMWKYTSNPYHYWVYYDDSDLATRSLLWTLEKYHEPVIVAAWHGSHWVLVTGYKSDSPAYYGPPGQIYQIKVADPDTGIIDWFNYSSGYKSWTSYWFTPYTDAADPDPSTGWYIPPPDHWKNHFVTIERDNHNEINPDIGLALQGYIPTHRFSRFMPAIAR